MESKPATGQEEACRNVLPFLSHFPKFIVNKKSTEDLGQIYIWRIFLELYQKLINSRPGANHDLECYLLLKLPKLPYSEKNIELLRISRKPQMMPHHYNPSITDDVI